MIGAHYTSTDDILLLIEPVVMDPLRRRWAAVQQSVLAALAEEKVEAEPGISPSGAPSNQAGAPSSPSAKVGPKPKASPKARELRLHRPALELLQDWAAELTQVRILDPACGSGNFLYVALKRLLDLWHEARVFAIAQGLTLALDPIPNPGQLFGIEIDFYAHEIASIVVWIGFLQWKHDHGVKDEKEPLLQKLSNIEHADAIMRYDAEGKPYEPEWPEADYIVGNPPFLGGNRLRKELGDVYTNDLFVLYVERVPAFADLVCYWFERSRKSMARDSQLRVGLIATQGIRGGVNRLVLENIKVAGDIFLAYSDRNWVLNGANVHISMVAFDTGMERGRSLNGLDVEEIYADLSAGGVDITDAHTLGENIGMCFIGPSPKGPFDINPTLARKMLDQPTNVNGKNNQEVVRRVLSAVDIGGRGRDKYTIDFGNMSLDEASQFEMPFEYVATVVKPIRTSGPRAMYGARWWQYGRPRPEMRAALVGLGRYIATPAVSKHRVFIWVVPDVLSNQGTLVFASDKDYLFGLLHSRVHELWARRTGTQVREAESGFRYTPTSTFDTFPFPWPPGKEPTESEDSRVKAIADAARELVLLRDAWLNPPGIPEADLKDRTLTKLYNKRPEWLANAHRILDAAVFAAYGWPESPDTLPDQEILAHLLALNHERAAQQTPK